MACIYVLQSLLPCFNNKKRSLEFFIQENHQTELNNGQVIKEKSTTKCLMKWIFTLLFFNTSTQVFSNLNVRNFLNKKVRCHRLRNISPSVYIRDHRRLDPLNYFDHNLNIFELRYNKKLEFIKLK